MIWESVDMLLHKTIHIFEEINHEGNPESIPSSASSVISSTTKKSALSESI